jgi:glutamate decarboxylase
VGWVVFRNAAALPDDLVFHVSYLGGDMIDFSINFSRPGSQVIAQYYNFLRLGLDGYRRVQQASQDVALYLSGEIANPGPFRLITRGDHLPVFCWTMDPAYAKHAHFTLYDLADKLRERGWLVPAYPMPRNRSDLVVQRIVVKEDFSRELAERLLEDLRAAVAYFESQPGHQPKQKGSHFHH